jgi:hypothetical protein
MPLPKHLREKFSNIDGTPLPQAPAGETDADHTAQAQPNEPLADTPPAVESTLAVTPAAAPEAPASIETPASLPAAPNATPVTAPMDQTPPAAPASGDFARREASYKGEITRLKGLVDKFQEDARGTTQLVDLLAQTRQELAELRTGKAAPSQVEPAMAPVPEAPELSADELALYGDFAPVAQKLIDRATAPLRQEIQELRGAGSHVNQQMGTLGEGLFVQDVQMRVPDMRTLTQAPEWGEFLKRPIPMTRMTVQDALMDSHNARSLEGVAAIFEAFKAEQARHRPATPAPAPAAVSPAPAPALAPAAAPAALVNGLAQFATPALSAANGSTQSPAQFKESDYRTKLDDMRAKRITKEEFLKFDQEYQSARGRGLVSVS